MKKKKPTKNKFKNIFQQTIVFPRIAIKSSPGALIVRETEKVLDERKTTRTEEVPCPLTGVPQLRTVEVVEKIIETEVVECVLRFFVVVFESLFFYFSSFHLNLYFC